jgi:hypothetical protein
LNVKGNRISEEASGELLDRNDGTTRRQSHGDRSVGFAVEKGWTAGRSQMHFILFLDWDWVLGIMNITADARLMIYGNGALLAW